VARAILAVVPDHVMTVGIFRDHLANEVLEITGALGLEAAQLTATNPLRSPPSSPPAWRP
jgi:phosphoribosylanthranilate isomerase